MASAIRAGVLICCSFALAGCAVGPNYKRPLVPVPQRYYGDERAAEARTVADAAWWDVFDDPILKGLIDEALHNGFDARLAAARVEEARARFGIARAEFFPSAFYEGGWQRARPDQLVNPSGETHTRWAADAGVSWELDLWGRIRRLNESARGEYLATEEGLHGVLLSLVSDVAMSMVIRYMRNPDGKRQETIEDYSFTRDATGSSGESQNSNGISTNTAQNCYGLAKGNGIGLYASTSAHNCFLNFIGFPRTEIFRGEGLWLRLFELVRLSLRIVKPSRYQC